VQNWLRADNLTEPALLQLQAPRASYPLANRR
jgi:hypothetical protein